MFFALLITQNQAIRLLALISQPILVKGSSRGLGALRELKVCKELQRTYLCAGDLPGHSHLRPKRVLAASQHPKGGRGGPFGGRHHWPYISRH